MSMNITTKQTSSEGAWQGDNPLNHALPLLIIQTTLVLFITRLLSFVLKPLRQPKVIAEILGGILLGPSALGRYKEFTQLVFPSWSTPILDSVASIGLLFFLFLVGLELDLSSIRRSGRRAFGIAVAGISLPFLFAAGVTFLLRKVVRGEDKVGYVQCLVFMGVALSITAFPVLARILAELKLLTTQIGETAMAAAAFNDVVAWILLALAVALAGNGSPLVSLWVLFSGVAFVVFMMVAVRPVMTWVVRKCSSEHDFIDEAYICLTLAGVLMSGFLTDLIGIHAIFGAFVFGLIIPKGGEFPARVIKRIEDFVSGLMLPLYFASSGLKTDVGKIQGAEAWGLLLLVISTACAGKILGTFLVAMLCMIPARESLALGVLMNTKGLVELIVLNIGKEKKVLNDEMFAILVLMALVTTFMTTPAVMAIYGPARQSHSSKRQFPLTDASQEELRVLACIYGPKNVPSLINLIDSIRAVNKSPLKLYVMHLVELTDRSSSIMMVQRARKNGFPFINRFRRGGSVDDHIAVSLAAYGQVGQVTIRHSTAISALSTMHEDVCHVAHEKRVAMILLPFHKQRRGEEHDETLMQNVGHGWRGVNQRILNTAPCSVAVLVDRGFGGGSEQAGAGLPAPRPKRVCIMLFGWQDDQVPKALELGERMAEHPTIRVTLMRFLGKEDKEMDDAAMDEFHKKWVRSVNYIEKTAVNLAEDVLLVGKSGEYDLIIAGKGELLANMGQHEHAELGLVGDLLASSGHNIVSSVLVIQEHKLTQVEKNQARTRNHDSDSISMVTIEESNV